ncbi:hypothetical protein CIL05_07395 [Virgibacillus profundi]|uniref:Uncharacterized protein n=1 Tax=Virgibacillus profundi TaxID=2024555 RepID=A0A2A2IGM5_9BACI|nr:hypothetical protein [Virgibacillus profundi]PAV30285.1 hypothetical protein CIL05_07395 [Virgibacillus profundi]PXY54457.1 hypothetical protein CIT14_07480 [Virgibacillus profundi]
MREGEQMNKKNKRILKEAFIYFGVFVGLIALVMGILALAALESMVLFVIVSLIVIFILCYVMAWLGNNY